MEERKGAIRPHRRMRYFNDSEVEKEWAEKRLAEIGGKKGGRSFNLLKNAREFSSAEKEKINLPLLR